MKRIDPQAVRGIWSVALLPWDDAWKLDERSFDANIERIVAAKPHGFYSLDTASEFYTLEFDEWLSVAKRFVSRSRALDSKLPLGLGCTWTNMAGAMRRVEAARDLGVQTIHLSAPYWSPLNEDALFLFFESIDKVAGHLGLVIYAPPWGKIDLTGSLFKRLQAAAPCIIGSKTPAKDPTLFEQPGSHFCGEPTLLASAKRGALGTYSALAGLSLPFTKHWWSLMEAKRWDEAAAIDVRVQAFYRDGVQPIRDHGTLNGAIDKTMAQVGGGKGSRRLRPPYFQCPDHLLENLRKAAQTHLPETMSMPW